MKIKSKLKLAVAGFGMAVGFYAIAGPDDPAESAICIAECYQELTACETANTPENPRDCNGELVRCLTSC